MCPPPRTKGWGAHSPAAKGVGESQFQRLEKRLALCLLCACWSQNLIADLELALYLKFLNTEPDPALYLNTDPDPALYFNADQDPALYISTDPDPALHLIADPDPAL